MANSVSLTLTHPPSISSNKTATVQMANIGEHSILGIGHYHCYEIMVLLFLLWKIFTKFCKITCTYSKN